MIEWLVSNWSITITGVLAVLGGASILAKLTPTQSDDKIIAAILKVINVLGLSK